jgi:hypothetical protein
MNDQINQNDEILFKYISPIIMEVDTNGKYNKIYLSQSTHANYALYFNGHHYANSIYNEQSHVTYFDLISELVSYGALKMRDVLLSDDKKTIDFSKIDVVKIYGPEIKMQGMYDSNLSNYKCIKWKIEDISGSLCDKIHMKYICIGDLSYLIKPETKKICLPISTLWHTSMLQVNGHDCTDGQLDTALSTYTFDISNTFVEEKYHNTELNNKLTWDNVRIRVQYDIPIMFPEKQLIQFVDDVNTVNFDFYVYDTYHLYLERLTKALTFYFDNESLNQESRLIVRIKGMTIFDAIVNESVTVNYIENFDKVRCEIVCLNCKVSHVGQDFV